MAISPDGADLYVASAVDDRSNGGPFSSFVSVFSRDPVTGALEERRQDCIGASDARHCRSGRGLSSPSSIIVSPDGRNVYAGSEGGITVFARHEGGSLSELSGGSGCVLAQAASRSCSPRPPGTGGTAVIALSPNGSNLYAIVSAGSSASNNPGNLLLTFTRNRATGVLRLLPGSAGCLAARPRPGCRVARGLLGLPWEFGLALSSNGADLYLSSGYGVASFARRPSDGRLDQLPGTAGCLGSADWTSACLTSDPVQPTTSVVASGDGSNVYVALGEGPGETIGPSLVTFSRDQTTGALTFESCAAQTIARCAHLGGMGELSAAAISPDDRNLYAVGLTGSSPAAARVLVFKRG